MQQIEFLRKRLRQVYVTLKFNLFKKKIITYVMGTIWYSINMIVYISDNFK